MMKIGFSFLVFIFARIGFAFEVGIVGGYRSLTSQTQVGVAAFHPQSGVRLSLFDKKPVAFDAMFNLARADLSGTIVEEQAYNLGLKLTPKLSQSYIFSALVGLSYFQTLYASVQQDHNNAFYFGLAITKPLPLFVLRLDIIDNVRLKLNDSFLSVNFSLGIRL
jgi:hypothetical protein